MKTSKFILGLLLFNCVILFINGSEKRNPKLENYTYYLSNEKNSKATKKLLANGTTVITKKNNDNFAVYVFRIDLRKNFDKYVGKQLKFDFDAQASDDIRIAVRTSSRDANNKQIINIPVVEYQLFKNRGKNINAYSQTITTSPRTAYVQVHMYIYSKTTVRCSKAKVYVVDTGNNDSLRSRPEPFKMIIDNDVWDELMFSRSIKEYTPELVDLSFRRAKELGVSRINWRMTSSGASNFPLKGVNYFSDMFHDNTLDRHSGVFCLNMAYNSKNSSFAVNKQLEPGQYAYSFWIKKGKSAPESLTLNACSEGKVIESKQIILSGEWSKHDLEINVARKSKVSFLLKSNDDFTEPAFFFVDTVKLNRSGKEKNLLENGEFKYWKCGYPVSGDNKSQFSYSSDVYIVVSGDGSKDKEIMNMIKRNSSMSWYTEPKLIDFSREKYKRSIKNDVGNVAIKSAKKYGVDLYFWWDFLDSGRTTTPPVPIQRGALVHRMPQYQMKNLEGEYHWGTFCFGAPEFRLAMTEILKELLKLDIDGVYLKTTSCHNHFYDPDWLSHDYTDYLYSDAAVKEYRKRYGNVPKAKMDKLKLQMIGGEFITQFLREIRPLVKASGKKLSINIRNSQSFEKIMQHRRIEWKKWISEGLVDDIVIEDRWNGFYHDYIPMISNSELVKYCVKHKMPVYCVNFINKIVQSSKKLKTSPLEKFHEDSMAIYNSPFSGMTLYEELSLRTLKLFPGIKKFKETIDSGDASVNQKSTINLKDYGENIIDEATMKINGQPANNALNDKNYTTYYGQNELPLTISFEFPSKRKFKAMRIYSGALEYVFNPSGEIGIKAVDIEAFDETAQEFKVINSLRDLPTFLESRDENPLYVFDIDLKGVESTKINLKVIESNDTLKRAQNRTASKSSVAIRQIEIY